MVNNPGSSFYGGVQGSSYPLPRKNFNPPLPIVEGGFGRGKIFSRYEAPWRPPYKRVSPDCLPLPGDYIRIAPVRNFWLRL